MIYLHIFLSAFSDSYSHRSVILIVKCCRLLIPRDAAFFAFLFPLAPGFAGPARTKGLALLLRTTILPVGSRTNEPFASRPGRGKHRRRAFRGWRCPRIDFQTRGIVSVFTNQCAPPCPSRLFCWLRCWLFPRAKPSKKKRRPMFPRR